MKHTQKAGQTPSNESTLFGENTAATIVVISATTTEVGTIIYCNNEIHELLGFQPRELVGKNVSTLMPTPIAMIHDEIINNYFKNSKTKLINN